MLLVAGAMRRHAEIVCAFAQPTVHTATPSRVAPPPPVHIGRGQKSPPAFHGMTAVDAVMVSWKASPVSRGDSGVVHAILDVSQLIKIFLCREIPVPIVLYCGRRVRQSLKYTLLLGLRPT